MAKGRYLYETNVLVRPSIKQTAPKFDRSERRCYDDTAGWSSLVARWAHNPKVGGSNPPPATNAIIGLPVKSTSSRRGRKGRFGGPFYFAAFNSGRSTICTTLLLASRLVVISALPYTFMVVAT